MKKQKISGWKDDVLFTPGPLTTSSTVKREALRDLGSRDHTFIALIREIRDRVKMIAAKNADDFEMVPMQGSGTFGVEAMITTAVPRDAKLLIIVNGAYGRRIAKIADYNGIDYIVQESAENEIPDSAKTEELLQKNPDIYGVAVIHCETTTGIINDIKAIGEVVHKAGKVFLVDAMSSFAAIPLDMDEMYIDFMVSSANKCIEGIPGFSLVVARRSVLEKCQGNARSLTLDLYDQWRGLEKNGQFRFTPPIQSLLAFKQALDEFDLEGGVPGRSGRYEENFKATLSGMMELGFQSYIDEDKRGYIITSFLYPDDENFDFEEFYKRLKDRGQVIYPGKLSQVDCFRIGSVGRIFPQDVETLLLHIREVLKEMNVALPIHYNS